MCDSTVSAGQGQVYVGLDYATAFVQVCILDPRVERGGTRG